MEIITLKLKYEEENGFKKTFYPNNYLDLFFI